VTRPPTAVVICAYTLDRWDDLHEAVLSAAAQQPVPDEIVLVIDHNDALLERAGRELGPEVPGLRVVANVRRQGLSGARNTALELLDAEVVAFLDDDACADPEWLVRLTAPYVDPAVIAVGGSATPRWSDGAARPVTLPATDGQAWGELDWVVGCSYQGQPTSTRTVRNVMGCNMSFRREVFVSVGGFSEDLGRVGRTPLGCEETELCIRATTARPDARVVFEPTARVRHHVSDDRLTWSYLLHRCYAEGVSKAAVSAMVGQDKALATERGYVTTVLPRGVLRCLGGAVRDGGARLRALAGAAAIVGGLSATVLGYARGKAAAPVVLGRSVPRLEQASGAAR